MWRGSSLVGLLAGLILGVVITVLLSGAQVIPRAMAQAEAPQPPIAAQRYQIYTWAYPAGSLGPGGGGSLSSHGAYVLDTRTGEVWYIRENEKPEALGSVR